MHKIVNTYAQQPHPTSKPPAMRLRSILLIRASCVLLVLSLSSGAFASSTARTFVGEFTGEGLTLLLKEGQGNLVGKLATGGAKYRVTAKSAGDLLKGTFRAGEDRFEFTGKRQGQDLILRSGGATYRLRPSSPATENPLAAKAASTSRGRRTRSPDRTRKLQIAKRIFRGAAVVAVAALKASSGGSGSAASPGQSSGPWPEKLVGKRWYEFSHSSGMSEKTVYTLCPGGRFTKSSGMSASDSMNGFGAAGQGGDQGRWAASGAESQGTLRLTYSGGGSDQKTLRYEGDTLMVDGKRWLGEAAQCR